MPFTLFRYVCIALIALFLYPPCHLLMRQWMRKRAWLAGLGLCLLLAPPCFMAFRTIVFRGMLPEDPQQRFNPGRWSTHPSERYQMLNDIVEAERLEGLDSIAVGQLLGQPSSREIDASAWHYELGAAPAGFGAGFFTLHVRYKGATVLKANYTVYED